MRCGWRKYEELKHGSYTAVGSLAKAVSGEDLSKELKDAWGRLNCCVRVNPSLGPVF